MCVLDPLMRPRSQVFLSQQSIPGDSVVVALIELCVSNKFKSVMGGKLEQVMDKCTCIMWCLTNRHVVMYMYGESSEVLRTIQLLINDCYGHVPTYSSATCEKWCLHCNCEFVLLHLATCTCSPLEP